MPVTLDNALDEMYGMIKTVVDAESAAIVGYVPEIRWPGAAKASKPDNTKIWLRVTNKIVVDEQRSLADGNGTGTKRYTAIGFLIVQIFAPRTKFAAVGTSSNMLIVGKSLGIAIRDKFRHPSPSGAIWFRDQKVDELSETPEYYPHNVTVTFQFDTIE